MSNKYKYTSQPIISSQQADGFNRREFLGITAVSAAAVALGEIAFIPEASAAISSTPLPAELTLPWADTELAPTISQNTLSFHFGKHHKGYLSALNSLLASTDPDVVNVTKKLQGKSLEQIIIATHHKRDVTSLAIYRNAAQVYNHSFYWNSLSPAGGNAPNGKIADLIDHAYGDYEKFKADLIAAALAQFGTGWAWVVLNHRKRLKIITTGDADTPITMRGVLPLLTIDVWEHAYYLDYQNARKTYVTNVVEKLLNWDFANANLGQCGT